MKLELVLGVVVVVELDAEPFPVTPPLAPTSDAGPLPFAQRGARSVSSIEAEAIAGPRLAEVTSPAVNADVVDWNVNCTGVGAPAAGWLTPVARAAASAATDAIANTRGRLIKRSHLLQLDPQRHRKL